MSERASYREQKHGEQLSVFADRFRTDSYDYSIIEVYTRGLLGYTQRIALSTNEAPSADEYLAVYTDSQESAQKMNLLGQDIRQTRSERETDGKGKAPRQRSTQLHLHRGPGTG